MLKSSASDLLILSSSHLLNHIPYFITQPFYYSLTLSEEPYFPWPFFSVYDRDWIEIGYGYFRSNEMDIPRMFGKIIVMIIPAFVGAGAVWHVSHSWMAIGIWTIVMVIFTCVTALRKDLQQLLSSVRD
jgi:hypothetical protein